MIKFTDRTFNTGSNPDTTTTQTGNTSTGGTKTGTKTGQLEPGR